MTDKKRIQTRIVVACDLSETGDHALRQAVELAKGLEGREELHITHVISGSRNLAQLSSELQGKLEELRSHTTALCAPPAGEPPFDIECVFHVRVGEPAAAIHQVAVDVGADLIVVGTHGRPRMQELVLGSVAQELMRMARVSVLVAHPNTLSELPKSARAEPARPGENMEHDKAVSNRVRIEFVPRTSHISGLI